MIDRHAIRYLNRVSQGDTAFFVTEPPHTWQQLESAHPNVPWYCAPVDRLPDIFESPFDELAEAGQWYAESRKG